MLIRVVVNCTTKVQTVVPLTPEEETNWRASRVLAEQKEQIKQTAETDKKDKKANLLTQPNKSVTVQDLLDLGLI